MRLAHGSDWMEGDLPPCADRSVLAAAEGGDHVLRLLAMRPRRLAVIDRNPAQLRLVELKRAGLQALDRISYLELLGHRPSRRRRALYQRIRWLLGKECDEFWLARLSMLDRGVALQGTFERRLASFGHVVRLIQGGRPRFPRSEWRAFLWKQFGHTLWERWFHAPAERADRLLAEGRLLRPPRELSETEYERAKEAANRILVVDGPPESYLRSLPSRSVDVFVLGRLDPEGLEDELARVATPGARATLVTERDPKTCLRGFVAERAPLEAGFFPGSLVMGSYTA